VIGVSDQQAPALPGQTRETVEHLIRFTTRRPLRMFSTTYGAGAQARLVLGDTDPDLVAALAYSLEISGCASEVVAMTRVISPWAVAPAGSAEVFRLPAAPLPDDELLDGELLDEGDQ
jgi:hypothetical protein